MSRGVFAAALLGITLLGGAAAHAAGFEYLYVESNVGGSSGGHAAVRLGDRVFHYQNVAGGSLRLKREPFDGFRYLYTVLENRSVHVGRVALSDASYERIHDHFNRRYLIEKRHFSAHDARRRDVGLLLRIAAPDEVPEDGAQLEPMLRAAGFFDVAGEPPEKPARTLTALRARVGDTHGADALARRSTALTRALAALRPVLADDEPDPRSRDRLPTDEYAFSERFSDLAEARAAVDVLTLARPLREDALRTDTGADWRLTSAEREALTLHLRALEDRLVALFGDPHPGWGLAALVGMARLQAIEASLASDHWVVLDAFPASARRLTDVTHPGRAAFFEELRRFSRASFFDRRAELLAAGGVGERAYNGVEAGANRALEVREGLATGRDVRVFGGPLAPHGERPAPTRWLPQMAQAELATALPVARAREESSRRALRALYGYELITNNCVSALFDTIESAFEPSEVAERLGGRVSTEGSLNFIPWVSFDAVKREYRVAEVGEIPSLRMTRMARMYARENRAKVYLRESNTLTSSVYRPRPHDPFFLFFTDDVLWPRPIYGAVNLLAGVGQAMWGLLRLPFDGPDDIVSGAKGAFFSLPELFFVNLRKGSLDYGPSREARTGVAATSAADGRAASSLRGIRARRGGTRFD